MSAVLLEHPTETLETGVSCEHCPAVRRLERALEQLQADFRREVGYWKSQPPPKLIPKGNYGISIWVLVLLDKYSSYRPTERMLGQLQQYDLVLPAGTINDGLQRIEPLLRPIYKVLCERNRQGDFHQADETRWLVFAVLDGKKGHGWWLWVILGADTVVYLLDPSRGHEVPESHFGPQASGAPPGFRRVGSRSLLGLQSHDAGEVSRAGRHVASDGGGDASSSGGRTFQRETPPAVSQGFGEPARTLVGLDAICGWPAHSDGQQRIGASRPRPCGGAQTLLRLRLVVERPTGGDDVFALCDAGPLEDQPATVALVVLGKLCGSRRADAGGHSTILAVESLTGTSRGIGGANHAIIYC